MLLTVTGYLVQWNFLLFSVGPWKYYKQPRFRIIAAGCKTSYTGLIVNVKMNIAVTRASILPCPDHWNSLRAVLIRVCVSLRHPISHFFKVVPFALFIWVQIMLFPPGPNVLYLIGDLPWQSVIAHNKRKR